MLKNGASQQEESLVDQDDGVARLETRFVLGAVNVGGDDS